MTLDHAENGSSRAVRGMVQSMTLGSDKIGGQPNEGPGLGGQDRRHRLTDRRAKRLAGGLYRSGKTFTIPDISWTWDGQSIIILGLCGRRAGPSRAQPGRAVR
jgi:hypothetical protein